MPIREYKCPECGLLNEQIILAGTPPETTPCKRCHTSATLKLYPSSISLSRSTMDNAPMDNFIGRDSDTKWALLKDRQANRDHVRVETATQGLTAVGIGKTGAEAYKPISPSQKTARTEMTQAIAATGHGKTLRIPGDPKK